MPAWLLVALGGAAGALARYWLGGFITARLAAGGAALWHGALATFTINVSGAFAIGVIAALAVVRADVMTPELRLLTAVGFCGAYTTFSTFSLETWGLIEKGAWGPVALYVIASNLLGLAAVVAGAALGRALAHP